MTENYSGKRIWIIGGSSGIGLAFAAKLAEEGAKIAISGRNEKTVAEAVASLNGSGHLAVPVDAEDLPGIDSAIAKITQSWGGFDWVVFAAGTYTAMRAFKINLAEAKKIFSINFIGALNVVSAVVPKLLAQKSGKIIMVSSVAGYRGLPNSLVYGASKAALTNFTETLYLDLKDKGIDVHLVSPGFVKTKMTDQNEFKMPALISPEAAAIAMVKGIKNGCFEIHFPKRFTFFMKLLRIMPNRLYLYVAQKFTGL